MDRDNELNETLDLRQRQQRALMMRRNRAKMERAREMAQGRMASQRNIRKRAFEHARDLFRVKVAGKLGKMYDQLPVTEKIAIDKMLDGKQQAIEKLALKLIPRVQREEQIRLQSFVRGRALQNMGQEEGNHPSQVNEATKNKKKAKQTLIKDDGPDLEALARKRKNPNVTFYQTFGEEALNNTETYRHLQQFCEGYTLDVGLAGWVFDVLREGEHNDLVERVESVMRGTPFIGDEDLYEAVASFDALFPQLNEQVFHFIIEPVEVERQVNATHPDSRGRLKRNRLSAERGEMRESFENWTVKFKPGDRVKIVRGDFTGTKGTVLLPHETDGGTYLLATDDGKQAWHHVSTMDPETHNESFSKFALRAAHERIQAHPMVESAASSKNGYTINLKEGYDRKTITAANSKLALNELALVRVAVPEKLPPKPAAVSRAGHYAVSGFDPNDVSPNKPAAHVIVINALSKQQAENIGAQHLKGLELLTKYVGNTSDSINTYKQILEKIYNKPIAVVNAAVVDGRMYESITGTVEPILNEKDQTIGWVSTDKYGDVRYWQPFARASAVYHAQLFAQYGLTESQLQKVSHILQSIEKEGFYATRTLEEGEKLLLKASPAFQRQVVAALVTEGADEVQTRHIITPVPADDLAGKMDMWAPATVSYGVAIKRGLGPFTGCKLMIKPSGKEGDVWCGNKHIGTIVYRNDAYIPVGSDRPFGSMEDAANFVAQQLHEETSYGNSVIDPNKREIGTDSLVNAYKMDTPGQIPDEQFLQFDEFGNPINQIKENSRLPFVGRPLRDSNGDSLRPGHRVSVRVGKETMRGVYMGRPASYDATEDTGVFALSDGSRRLAHSADVSHITEGALNEKLSPSDPMSVWIRDFQDSDAPQFEGKTKAERRKMAIAAKLQAMEEEKQIEEEVHSGLYGGTHIPTFKRFNRRTGEWVTVRGYAKRVPKRKIIINNGNTRDGDQGID